MYRLSTIALLLTLAACRPDGRKPDVSHINVQVEVARFEQAFFQMDTTDMARGLAALRNAHPRFYAPFMQHILQVDPRDTASYPIIRHIRASYQPIYDSIEKKYPRLDWLERELRGGFRYVKYYYPHYALPQVITFVGTLDAPGVVLTDEFLGIGLHQYAGKNFSVYHSPEVLQLYPAYISRRFDREYMAANALRALADDIYPDQSVGRPLIEQMVEKGKQWYLLQHLAPDAPDSIVTGYTQKQLDWAERNEGNVWAFLLKNENLYSIEPYVIQTYIGEAPFTQGMPEASPGNIGQWIGWRIVERFAQKNEELTLQQVLQTPARSLFEAAGYKPK